MEKLLCVTAILVQLFITQAQGQVYQVIDLGALGGTASYANAINNSGQIVGYAYVNGADHAFLYANGSMQDLGDNTADAHAINTGGQIVGQQNNASFITDAFLDGNGSIENLGDNATTAWGINTSGQIVGYLTIPYMVHGNQDAFLYSGGSISDLHPQAEYPGANSQALAINDNGTAVGFIAPLGNAAFQAVVFTSPVTYLGNLGGNYSIAYAINNNGAIVGVSATTNGSTDVFLYQNGVMRDIGSGTEYGGYGINKSGVVVGQNGNGHAFIYVNSVMMDLNSLIRVNSGWTLQDATAINDAGYIAGYGVNPMGQTHAFLLNPLPPTLLNPPPPTLAVSTVSVPMITITGGFGNTYNLQYEYENAYKLAATITITNDPQYYYDVPAIGQPQRFYHLIKVQ